MNDPESSTARALRIYWMVVALLLLVVAGLAVSRLLHWGPAIEAAETRYPEGLAAGCEARPRGLAGRHERRSRRSLPYVVVTPRNYRAEYAHPLLLVYAPAGVGAGLSERHAGLTQAATAAGFVLAFAGGVSPLSTDAVAQLAELPEEIREQWCIDAARVYASGHSDGGTVALALAALPQYRGRVRGIVASAAGWQARDFAGIACPPPLPVMILHGAEDRHFPGFGREVAAWWSACNACTGSGEPDADGCRTYSGCAAETLYCETPDRGHWRWVGEPEEVLAFLRRQR